MLHHAALLTAEEARAAGMEVIAVIDPMMSGEDFSGALRVVHSLEQISLDDLGL